MMLNITNIAFTSSVTLLNLTLGGAQRPGGESSPGSGCLRAGFAIIQSPSTGRTSIHKTGKA